MSITPESIDVPSSPDNGNVPVDHVPAPSPEPKEPAAAAEPAAPANPPAAPELFELPDGRKVDSATLAKEFRENFLPDYTRKSQELAKVKGGGETPKEINNPADPLSNPEYVPKDYSELAKVIRESTLREIEARDKAVIEQQMAVEKAVEEQLNAVKAIDKNVNENALFLHATKYQFKDLRLAHQNMKDMEKVVKETKQSTAKEVLKRNDPVSVIPGTSGGQRPDPSQFATARDYLRSLKG